MGTRGTKPSLREVKRGRGWHAALLRGEKAQVWGCEWGSGSIMGRQISHSKMFPGKPGETLKIYSCSKPGKTNPC